MVLNLLSNARREPAGCLLELAGEEVVDLYPYLVDISVSTARAQAAVATLRFETRRNDDGTWTVQDDARIAPWSTVLIAATFGDDTEEVMRGFVREVRAEYPAETGSATVIIECQDESLALDRTHLRETWGADAPTSDQAIVTQILERNALFPHADNADGQTELVVNQDGTDVSLLKQRAQANGYELIFHAGEVYFGPMRLEAEPQATVMVYAGKATNCIEFAVQDDGHLPDSVSFELASVDGAEAITRTFEPNLPLLGATPANSLSAGLSEFSQRMSREGVNDESEMSERAQQLANEQSMKVQASGELDGSLYGHVLRVAQPVGVDGVGDRYGGIWYVNSVEHRFDANGYRQSFELIRNAYGDNLPNSASGLSAVL